MQEHEFLKTGEYPEVLKGCGQCTRRWVAFQTCKEELSKSSFAAEVEQGLRKGASDETFDYSCGNLLHIWSLYATCGVRCRGLLDAEIEVNKVVKKCKAVLVSSDRGVRFMAERWSSCLDAERGVLDISRSELREVCDLAPLTGKLVKLDVSHNRNLVKLPLSSLCKMESLKDLVCVGCKLLISPPHEIARQGSAEVMSFLRSVHALGALNTQVRLRPA